MRGFSNAGFGNPIGAQDLGALKGLKYEGVRQDIPAVVSVVPIAEELVRAGMAADLVLARQVWACPISVRQVVAGTVALHLDDVYYEMGNECDAGKNYMDPLAYARSFNAAEQAAREVNMAARIITAGITSTHRAGLDWLSTVIKTGLISQDAIVGYHSYRDGDPQEPHEGFPSRSAEFLELRRIAQGRRIANTEIGWSDGSPKRTVWPCSWFARGLSEGQVAQYLRKELEINRSFEAEFIVIFQLQDGTGRDEHFGIRRRDGTWKPSAFVLEAA